jgi:hypothetical protein
MGQAENIAVGEIESARSDLDRDLAAFEARFRRETDWKFQYRRRPWAFIGASFVLGLGFSMLLGGKRETELDSRPCP